MHCRFVWPQLLVRGNSFWCCDTKNTPSNFIIIVHLSEPSAWQLIQAYLMRSSRLLHSDWKWQGNKHHLGFSVSVCGLCGINDLWKPVIYTCTHNQRKFSLFMHRPPAVVFVIHVSLYGYVYFMCCKAQFKFFNQIQSVCFCQLIHACKSPVSVRMDTYCMQTCGNIH